jgi:hypothetical protein
LNFIRFSGNVKEIENSKTGAHNAGPALAHDSDDVRLAHEPFWPVGVHGRRSAARSRDQHARGRVLASGPAVTGRQQGLAHKHHGVFGVASGRVEESGAHPNGAALVEGRWRLRR